MVIKKSKSRLQTRREKVEITDLIMLQRYIEALWNFFPLPVCDINGSFIIINVGKRFLDFFGFKQEEIVGESVGELFSSQKEFEEFRKELLAQGVINQKEVTILTKNKKEIPVSLFAETRKEKGTTISYFIAFIDLRETKKREKELQERLKELEAFHRLIVGRELKMVELKNKIKELQEKIKKVEAKKSL